VPLGLSQYLLISVGALTGLAGFWLLIRRRFSRKPEPLHIAGLGDKYRPSEPTRLACGLILLILGYHGVIWALPEYLTAVQLTRKIWYVWILIGIFAIAASFFMDRFDREETESGGNDAP
jgi:hypothetical protein